jgi:exodeoxyribonuclease VII large subunit
MSSQKIWKVSEVNSAVRELIENSLMPFWLQGEVGTLNIHSSGHVYLTLKDKKAQIRGVFFSGARQARSLGLKVGMEVEVFGQLTVYEVRGEYQFSIRQLRPLGVGELQRRFEELKNKLLSEGLFDESRKKPMPALPGKIGVVTSPDGAAIRDFLQIINRRFPNINIKIYPAAVQGKGAEKQVAKGVKFFNKNKSVDVIVVTRGGGSMEDLWPFNEELLAREIAASKIPVISAVGHEIDFTISDFVSDLRAPTPSAAAELVIGRQEEFTEKLGNLKRRMLNSLELKYEKFQRRYSEASKSYVFREPARLLREKQQMLDELASSLESSVETAKEDAAERLARARKDFIKSASRNCELLKIKNTETSKLIESLALSRIEKATAQHERLKAKLEALSPLSVLQRGYAVISDETGKIVKDPELPPGTNLKARILNGTLDLTLKKGTRNAPSGDASCI